VFLNEFIEAPRREETVRIICVIDTDGYFFFVFLRDGFFKIGDWALLERVLVVLLILVGDLVDIFHFGPLVFEEATVFQAYGN
jgi:hypothetical protein